MAATSPYTPNDYTAVSNFRPYELPINDIFRASMKLDEFWKAGAAKVKGVYDNALNLKLTLEPNKEIRRKFIEDSEKELTKLSAMDLSDPTNQRKGFGIFKPLFRDEGIVYDDLATRHFEKVRNDALSFRGKDNGKQYSDINFRYAMKGYEQFATSKDRMAGKAAYTSRREYTPYYDYTEDFQKALKDCKPSSVHTQSPVYGKNSSISGYMVEDYSKSLSAAQARGCIEAGMSPNGLRQMQIEGSVSYENNIDVLASDTSTYLSQVGKNLSSELERIEAAKAVLLKNPNNLTKEQLDITKQQLELESKNLVEELDKTNNQVAKIQGGDHTDILNNFDSYAGSVYTYKKLYKKALASAYEDRRMMYKMDPIQALHIRFKNEEYLARLDNSFDVSLELMKQQHDGEMKMLDIMYGGKGTGKGTGTGADIYKNPLTGEITVNPLLMRESANLTGTPEPDDKIYEKLTTKVSELSAADNMNNLTLYNGLIARADRDKDFRNTLLKGFNYGTTDDEWTRFKASTANNRFSLSREGNRIGNIHETTWFKAYMGGQPNDEQVNKWATDYSTTQVAMNTLNRKIELAEKQVAAELGGDQTARIQENIKGISSATIYRGEDRKTAAPITVTPQEMQAAIEGTSDRVKIVNKSYSGAGYTGTTNREDVQIFVDGIEVKEKSATDSPIKNLYNKVREVNHTVNDKLKSKRVEVYNKLGFDREPWYFTPNDEGRLVETLKTVFKDKEGKELPISIVSSDFAGGVKVSIPQHKKDDILTKLRALGVGTSVEMDDNGFAVIRGTIHNVIPQAINNPVLRDAAYQLDTVAETAAFQQTQPGAKVPNADINVPVYIAGKMKNMTIETYRSGPNPEFRVYLEGTTTPYPIIVANNPYELFEKIHHSQIQFKQQIK